MKTGTWNQGGHDMKRSIIMAIAVALASPAWAGSRYPWPGPLNNTDYGKEELKKKVLVANEVLELSLDGTQLHRIRQTGTGGAEKATTRFLARVGKKKTYVYATTVADEKKGLGVRIARYRKSGPLGSGKGEGLIEEKTYYFPDFASVTVELARTKKRKTVVRFTPFVGFEPDEADQYEGKLLHLDGVLIKNGKQVVARVEGATGEKITISTPELGTLDVALAKFKGGEPIGRLRGKTLTFEIGDDKYEWMLAAPILPSGPWIVWIRHDPEPRYPGANSVQARDL